MTSLCVLCVLCVLCGSVRAGERSVAPEYGVAMWVEDSLTIADAVVIGAPRRGGDDTATMDVDRVLRGELKRDGGVVRLCPPYRCRWNGAGLWMLLRTPQGYVAINPDENPIRPEVWAELQRLSVPRPSGRMEQEQNEASVTFRSTIALAGRDAPWMLSTFAQDDAVASELSIGGRRVLQRAFDEEGRISSIFRLDAGGNGLSISYERGRVWSYARFAGGKKDGVSREYFRHKPEQLREEITWKAGVRDGAMRTWDEDGKLTSELLYEDGFVAPVTRYRGPAPQKPPVSIFRNDRGVFYTAHVPVEKLIKPGMTTAEVSESLKVDFSEKSGITFPFFTRTRMLHISFADGKVAAMRVGDNSVCFQPERSGR